MVTEKQLEIEADNIRESYYQLLTSQYGVTRKSDLKLLVELDRYCDSKGNFNLTVTNRRQIEESLGLNKPNLSAALKRLKELNVITGEKGNYAINPDLFISDLNQDIKLIINLIKNQSEENGKN